MEILESKVIILADGRTKFAKDSRKAFPKAIMCSSMSSKILYDSFRTPAIEGEPIKFYIICQTNGKKECYQFKISGDKRCYPLCTLNELIQYKNKRSLNNNP